MQTHQEAQSTTGEASVISAAQLADPITKIAVMFGEITGEFERLGAVLRTQSTTTEAVRSPAPVPPTPPPTGVQGPYLRGEPVDTSFARPATAPAATAAGASPSDDSRPADSADRRNES